MLLAVSEHKQLFFWFACSASVWTTWRQNFQRNTFLFPHTHQWPTRRRSSKLRLAYALGNLVLFQIRTVSHSHLKIDERGHILQKWVNKATRENCKDEGWRKGQLRHQETGPGFLCYHFILIKTLSLFIAIEIGGSVGRKSKDGSWRNEAAANSCWGPFYFAGTQILA